MEKTLRTEIENEYKSQINELEENLAAIGNFEAEAQLVFNFKMITSIINFLFSWLFFSIGTIGLFIVIFYFGGSMAFIDKHYSLGINAYGSLLFLKYVLIFMFILCLLLSTQIKIIRRKNSLICNLGIFVSDFKIRSVRMHDLAKERLKNFNKMIAEDRFVNRK